MSQLLIIGYFNRIKDSFGTNYFILYGANPEISKEGQWGLGACPLKYFGIFML